MKKIITSAILCMGLTQAADITESTGSEDLTVREVADHVWDKTQSQVLEPTFGYLTGGRFEKDADRALYQAVKVEQDVENYINNQASQDIKTVEKKVKKDKKRLEKNVKREKNKLLGKAGIKSKKKRKK